MRQLSLIFILTLFSVATIAQNVGQEGKDTLNYKDINGLKQGKWIKKYYNGNKKYEGYFVDDTPKGVFKRYDNKGRLIVRQYYYGDSLQCSTTMFRPNGDTLSCGRYYNKKKDSTWHYFNKDGNLMMTESYKRGTYHGDFIYYYPDGSKWQYIHYTNGKKNGKWKRFYKNGQPIFETRYEDGMRQDTFRSYYPGGQPEFVIPYVDDLRHGKYYLYDKKGRLIESRKYIHGELQNADQYEKKETKNIDKLLRNRGKYGEPYDEGMDFFREDRY